MIDDYILTILDINTVIAVASFQCLDSGPDPDPPDDHIMGITDIQGIVFKADPVSRRSLTCNGNIGVINPQVAIKIYRS